ncbi:hypothetical protein OHC33_000972 [Knufia fluminis]|uniref:BTB domain-containing protein n=1 Tax=Knufia fluminis TaxID=191047 RepID=A0AAN8EL40_9EURO|nr:hypothetical protein OHC33_000972 [Knufia fluminis]
MAEQDDQSSSHLAYATDGTDDSDSTSATSSTVDESIGEPDSFAKQIIITVHIGPDHEAHHIHRDLLCEKSPYFAAALKECWSKGVNEYVLEDIAPADFDVIVHWVYKEKLPWYLTAGGFQATGLGNAAITMRHMYALADRWMMHDLQNALVDEELKDLRNMGNHWDWSGLRDVCDQGLCHTPSYTVVMRSFVGWLAETDPDDEEYRETINGLGESSALLREVFLQLHMFIHEKWVSVSDARKCDFHIHPNGQKCDYGGY